MQIFKDIEAFDKTRHRPLVLALGNFDGVHLGHQKILSRVVEQAEALGSEPAVFTFQEHPQKILRPELSAPGSILSPEYKLLLIEQLGIEICFFMPFTEAFSKQKPESFVRDILVKHLGMKKMLLGYNARFGHARKGDPALMRQLAQTLGFEFEEIGPVEVQGEAVSSSRIRKLLSEGLLDEAAACLGRPFSLLGKVVAGESRGKEIGFPTANIESQVEVLLPFGVYPVRVREINGVAAGEMREGVLNFGIRPTFGGGTKPVLEAFIFNFQGNLYGKTLEVFFYPQLRPEQNFKGPEALKTQISQDIEEAKRYFTKLGH